MITARTPVSVDDYRMLAKARLPRMVFDYLEGGAEREHGLSRNLKAYEDLEFLPKKLVDVSQRSQSCTLWNRDYAMPVFIAPTGLNGIFRPQADAMLARAAAQMGIPFVLSTASNMTIKDIAELSDGEKWFQLYVVHRDIADVMCDRALSADYEALVLTVDVPVNGYRERDMRNQFGLPLKYSMRMLLDGLSHPSWSLEFLRTGVPQFCNFSTIEKISPSAQQALIRRELDASLDYDFLKRLRDRWPKKLIVKGLCRPEDVMHCAEAGVDAVVLSNHGARQLDSAVSSLKTLSDCVNKVSIPVFVDGGVRRGSDVLKAVCLGASMVGLGRAVLYAVAADGECGVMHCLSIIKDEMDRAQAMLGAAELRNLDRGCLTYADTRPLMSAHDEARRPYG